MSFDASKIDARIDDLLAEDPDRDMFDDGSIDALADELTNECVHSVDETDLMAWVHLKSKERDIDFLFSFLCAYVYSEINSRLKNKYGV